MAQKRGKTVASKERSLGSARLVAAINQQVGNEMHASLQYVAIASWFDAENLPRLAQFFFRQAEEERDHAMKFVRFVIDIGGRLKIPAIGAPRADFAAAAEPVALSLEWEHTVTEQIYALVDIAREERNYIAQRFLDWFVNEQLEEINTMETLLSMIRRAGEDNLLLVEDYVAEHEIIGAHPGGGAPASA